MTAPLNPEKRLSALIQRFRALAWTAAAGSICEVNGANDPGHDYCKTCARWEVRRLHHEGTYPDAEVEGGWDPHFVTDAPAYCVSCDRLLHYNLGPDGIGDEVKHWDRRAWTAPVAPNQAYRLEQLLAAVDYHHYDQPDMIRRAAEIGERAAAHLPD